MEKYIKLLKYLILVFTLTFISGCFPTIETHLLKKENWKYGITEIDSPSKVFLNDLSMIIFEEGFSVSDNKIYGSGTKYRLGSNDTAGKTWLISLDSVQAITVHNKKMEGSRLTANILLGIFGTTASALSIYCAACPKCCFGSCPTVYTFDGSEYNFETELFSYSIAKQLEENDLDLLNQKVPENGIFRLKVTNEALETHYINKLSLILANHPASTKLLPTSKGKYILVSEPLVPVEAVNSEGIDVTFLIRNRDGNFYRSKTNMVKKLTGGISYDWLDIKTKVPENSRNVKLILGYRNTLLSTILLYEVVLGSQGIKAVNWTSDMNTDKHYASQFNTVYQTFSGIKIYENKNGRLINRGAFADAGPLNWKNAAEEFPLDGQKELKVRLQFIPDNFMIDYIAFDFSYEPDGSLTFEEIIPYEIKDGDGNIQNEVSEITKHSDAGYIVTNPGDSYKFDYKITKRYDCEQTVFIKSGGYYNEWIRGSWIRNHQLIKTGYTFNLADISGTLKCLAENWIYGKDEIEKEFFKNRIPVRRSK